MIQASAVLNKQALGSYAGLVVEGSAITEEKKPDRDWKEYNETSAWSSVARHEV